MDNRLRNTGLGAVAAGAVVAAGLAGCHQMSPQEKAQEMIRDCASEADEYLDPHWTPRQVTGVYPATDGVVDDVITAQGTRVRVRCGVGAGYYTHFLSSVASIEGAEPAPGQLYLPAQHRWLTNDELHTRLAGMLAPQPGEYAGVNWAPNPPGVYTVSDLAGVPSTPPASRCKASLNRLAKWSPARSPPATATGSARAC